MFHEHDDAFGAVDKVHGAAPMPFDHVSGDHPVGQVAAGGDLHGAEHRGVFLPPRIMPKESAESENAAPG
jgi:hypothetical protein